MNKTTSIIIGLVIGLALGYIWGMTGTASSYSSKIAAVNKLFPVPTQTMAVSGRVKEVSASSIVLEGVSVSSNPFAGDFPTTRTATITSETKIVKSEQKDPTTMQAEFAAFQKAMQNNKAGAPLATPPNPFSQKVIQLSDIKVGDIVTVTAANDILSASSFTATQVQLATNGK